MGGGSGRGRGFRVDVNEELKFLCNSFGGVGLGGGSGGRLGGSGVRFGEVRVDVNVEVKFL